jgi:hypothetical protein
VDKEDQKRREGEAEWLRDLRDRQQNTLWPGSIEAARSADSFFWHGSPNSRPIQRAGAIVIGLVASLFVLVALNSAWEERMLFPVPFALGVGYIAFRQFRNGLRRSVKRSVKPES